MKKQKLSIAIDSDLLEWIEAQIKTSRFANYSHAIQYSVRKLKESEEE